MKTCRLVCSVEIHHHLILRSHLSRSAMEIHHQLVVVIHEVDLEALDSHLRVMLAHLLHVSVEGMVAGPEDKSDITLLRICGKLFKVNFRNHLEKISLKIYRPSLIKNHIFDSVLRREIDIVFVSSIVDACTEIHSVKVPGIPPVPSHLARLHPAPVGCGISRSRKSVDHIIVRHLDIFFRHSYNSPREISLTLTLCDIILTALHQHLEHIVSTLFSFSRHLGETTFKLLVSVSIVNMHSRIIEKVSLCNDDLFALRTVDHNRKKCHAVLVPCRKRGIFVGVLE